MHSYAGIGSRDTPGRICKIFIGLAMQLNELGFILRSGGANGADLAFEEGADSNKKEIYLPWKNFNYNKSKFHRPTLLAFEVAPRFVPHWNNLKVPAHKALHARNIHQIAGRDLNDPVKMVICWTKDGETVGGTATAIRCAQYLNIPVINYGNPNETHEDRCNQIYEIIKAAKAQDAEEIAKAIQQAR